MKSKPSRLHNLGLLGTGSRALSLLECLRVAGRTRVVAAADTSEESRGRARPYLPEGCRIHHNARDLI
jgi:hypothetical protein